MAVPERERQTLLAALATKGLMSSQELQLLLGKSQPSVSRLLAEMAADVLPLGRGKSSRYGLPLSIHGRPAQQPIFWTTETGEIHEFGTLSHLAGPLLHIDSPWITPGPWTGMPWWLSPVQAQGFLGRLLAERLMASAGLDSNPERWGLSDILFAALHLPDACGAISLGEASPAVSPARLPKTRAALPAALDRLAQDAASTLPAGSSAGGEQPKFLAQEAGGEHVLVKFSPPRGTPFGERWHDLLHAEWVASQVLDENGIAAANTQVVVSAQRSYLISHRFDRVGSQGRRHVLSIGAAHQGFLADGYANWAASCAALARQKRLSVAEHERVVTARYFGHLIGNSDMHSGNLGLFVAREDLAKGRFALAPIYDMLPMRWRPNPNLGGLPDYQVFEPEARSLQHSAAASLAREFWARLGECQAISPALQALARKMTATIRP